MANSLDILVIALEMIGPDGVRKFREHPMEKLMEKAASYIYVFNGAPFYTRTRVREKFVSLLRRPLQNGFPLRAMKSLILLIENSFETG